MKIFVTLFLGMSVLLASVDINHATAKEFISLKGIGAKKAEAIVKYRESIKCFKSINGLIKVKGIGKATVSKNKENLILGKCKKD